MDHVMNTETNNEIITSEMMEEKAGQVAELLKVLSNQNRLLILCALIEQPLTVGELCERRKSITQSGVSQHLMILKSHGIIASVKRGQKITYFIRDKRIEKVIQLLKEQYCK